MWLVPEACVEEIETLTLVSGKPTVANARLESGEMNFRSVPGDLSQVIEVEALSILFLGGEMGPRGGELIFVQSTRYPTEK